MARNQRSPTRSQTTARRLITAGRRIFARRGFKGASIRAITQAAHANLGAVTYHFGSKTALYEAVVEECLEPLRVRIAEVVARPDPPQQRIEAAVRVFFDHLRSNPDTPQFLLQEVAAGASPSPPVLRTIREVLGGLASLIQEGVDDGAVRSVDPYLAAVSIVAQPVHLTLLGRLLGNARGALPALPRGRDSIENHAVDFVSSALRPAREG